MTFGSLFAGIGGFDLGLERAGMVCKWQVEIDPFCRRVLAKHWPDVPKFEDVRTVYGYRPEVSGYASDHMRGPRLEVVDVICGGFPCQDISLAGGGAGIDGERSGLWFHFDRIIGELRPRYVLVENVSALLGRGLGRVLGDLASRGYDAEWDCVPASAMRAPHQRDRVWVVAYADSERQLQPQGIFGDQRRRSSDGGQELSDADTAGLSVPRPKPARAHRKHGWGVPPASDWWAVEPAVGRVAHGLPGRVDRLKGLGNAVVPQIPEWIGRRLIESTR